MAGFDGTARRRGARRRGGEGEARRKEGEKRDGFDSMWREGDRLFFLGFYTDDASTWLFFSG
jgi:hypothetical protein